MCLENSRKAPLTAATGHTSSCTAAITDRTFPLAAGRTHVRDNQTIYFSELCKAAACNLNCRNWPKRYRNVVENFGRWNTGSGEASKAAQAG